MQNDKRGCKASRYYITLCYEMMLQHFGIPDNSSLPAINTKLNFRDESVESFTMEEHCNIGNLKAASIKPDDNLCEAATCIFSSSLNTPLERVINPMYKTSCGPSKYCFRGNCILKGHQLQHMESQLCLFGTKTNSPQDAVDLFPCEDNILPLHAFSVRRYGEADSYAFLVTPYTTLPNTKIEEKCLILDLRGNMLRYAKCPTTQAAAVHFLWRLNFTDDTNATLTIRLETRGLCLQLTERGGHVKLRDCVDDDPQSHWKFVPELDQQEHQDILPEVNIDSEVANASQHVFIAVGCIGAIAFLVVSVICGYKIGKKKRMLTAEIDLNELLFLENPNIDDNQVDENLVYQVGLLPYDKKWEIPYENISFGNQLGEGAFGSVFEAEVHGYPDNTVSTKVAVKIALHGHNLAPVKALASELKLISNIGIHVNIIKFLGACTESLTTKKKLCVVLEYCKNGNLLEYLRNNAARFVEQTLTTDNDKENHYYFTKEDITLHNFTSVNLVGWAYQVARGMSFLSSQRILHGDLAARNVLLDEDLVAKISDFGFSKHLSKTYDYNYKKALKDGMLPYKWMALESILKGIFSCQSDCWSYGVQLWEIFTLGNKPYPGMQVNLAFVNGVTNGYRMPKPRFCPKIVYDTMLECWSENTDDRPKFADIAESLGVMLGNSFESYYTQLELDFVEQDQNTPQGPVIILSTVETFEFQETDSDCIEG